MYSTRSVWIDEISSLLNYPLASLSDIFMPLPYAQQAAPASFNLLSTASYGLPVQGMRIMFALIIVLITGAAAIHAFGARLAPCLAVAGLMASFPFFFHISTELKFYGLEIAGAALVAAWVMRYDEEKPFGPIDLGILAAAIILGISTLVLAFGAVIAISLVRIRKFGWLKGKELALIGLLGIFGLLYYLQLNYAVTYQMESFPDAYDARGLDAVKKLMTAFLNSYGNAGCLVIAAMFATVLFHARQAGAARRFLIFCAIILAAFCVLAALGKYPATKSRHIAWTAGMFAMAGGLALQLALQNGRGLTGRVIAGLAMAAIAGNLVLAWQSLAPRERSITDNDKLVAWLEAAPPSDIVLYYGAPRLVAWQERRGAPIDQHRYFARLDLSSGPVEPRYLSKAYLAQDYATISKDITGKLTEPVGWARMAIVFRMIGNFSGYTEHVLDQAPAPGTFYIIATHVEWSDAGRGEDPRYTSLIDTLDARSCTHAMEMTGKWVFAMKVTCP